MADNNEKFKIGESRIIELDGISRMIQDNPCTTDVLNNAIDTMFKELGFVLTPEEKCYILHKLISKEKADYVVCAGSGARCCRGMPIG